MCKLFAKENEFDFNRGVKALGKVRKENGFLISKRLILALKTLHVQKEAFPFHRVTGLGVWPSYYYHHKYGYL